MAAADTDLFNCSICLDLLKDPVAIPCGHTYCMPCITVCWAKDDQGGVYSCPLCRQTFSPRPALNKNTMLADLAGRLREGGFQAASPAVCNAGPGDVECDTCIGRKQKAVKSCLVCLTSFCVSHLQPHYESPAYSKHKLVEPSADLQEWVCLQHDKPLDMFCREDKELVCALCLLDEHKGHDIVSGAAERKEKQIHLREDQHQNRHGIQRTVNVLLDLKKAEEALRTSAAEAVKNSERVFTELMSSFDRKRSEVTELIRAQENTKLNQVAGLRKQLKQELTELRKRDIELEQLSHVEDPIHFLQSFPSLSIPPRLTESQSIILMPYVLFDDVKKSVSNMTDSLEDFGKQELVKISEEVTKVQIILDPEPQTRQQLLKYSCRLTLDPNTAHRCLRLSEGNRKVTLGRVGYPDHPERFNGYWQVLCREGLSGRCYWEVELSGGVRVAASYKSINREAGNQDGFGFNSVSWSLGRNPSKYFFRHNNVETDFPVPVSGSRIGVYLDHRAGTLSFYSVEDPMTLLHRVQTTFTQPLYAGFGFSYHFKGSVVIMK